MKKFVGIILALTLVLSFSFCTTASAEGYKINRAADDDGPLDDSRVTDVSLNLGGATITWTIPERLDLNAENEYKAGGNVTVSQWKAFYGNPWKITCDTESIDFVPFRIRDTDMATEIVEEENTEEIGTEEIESSTPIAKATVLFKGIEAAYDTQSTGTGGEISAALTVALDDPDSLPTHLAGVFHTSLNFVASYGSTLSMLTQADRSNQNVLS